MKIKRRLINNSTIIHVTTTPFLKEGITISTLNEKKEVMEREPINSNPGVSVVVIIRDVIIVV